MVVICLIKKQITTILEIIKDINSLLLKILAMAKPIEKNIYHHAMSRILSSKKKNDAIHAFKNNLEFKILCQLVDGLNKSIKPLHYTFYGNSLPASLNELGKADTLFRPKSLESEINWVLISIRKFSKKLSLFVILKKEFEHNFLLGDYQKAEKILESIFCELGYSLWYIESRFLLLEYQNKSEEQKEFLSEINESSPNGLVGTLAHFLSFRTERNLSAYKYDYDINSIFRINNNNQEADTRRYYLFRLNFYEHYSFEDYSTLILFENCNSIIDRYLLLCDVIRVLSKDVKYNNYIFSKARYIFKKTNDCSLLPIMFKLDPAYSDETYFNERYIRILDLYYAGLYDDAIIECKAFILQESHIFDLLIIYAKCHISAKKELTKIVDEHGALVNQLSQKIFNLISSSENRKDLIYNLYQINKNLLSFGIAPGLDYFLKREQGVEANRQLRLLSNYYYDPYFSLIYASNEDALDYIKSGLLFVPNSISINHWQSYLSNSISKKEEVSDEIYFIDKAKVLFKQGLYEESIDEWSNITLLFDDNAPIIQTALRYWFDCLVKIENYNEAIKLYVDKYLIQPNSVNKIKSSELIEILRKLRYRGIKRSIDLPIFVSLNSHDDTEKSFVLEQYCKIFNRTRPSELFDDLPEVDSDKVEIFFSNVCSVETLKHSIYINTTIERLTERLNIINYLIESYPLNSKVYQEELNLISNELIIYEGTQKLEESKIYANDQAIINYELNEIEGLFNRYKTIYKLSLKDKKILFITESSYALFKLDGKDKYNETEVKYTDSALLEVFSELFDSILDKYLFSKFGVVAYLSTRIRHGVLLGEIRPEFEKQNLILNRIGNTASYEESKYWTRSFFNLDSQQKAKLHEILNKFSFKIDSIIEDIIKERIQIRKDGKNPNGLFNYEFEKNELYTYAIELASETDSKVFCQKVIDLIWKRTDANLDVIRAFIDNDIKNKFSEELNSLDKELRSNFTNQQFPDIFTNLINCSTIIENKLNKISSWFRRSGSSIDDFDIQKVFNIVWNNMIKCYPKVAAECNITLEKSPTIKSNYYIHFTDLFRILLDNMFKYGEVVEGKKQFEFRSYEENSYLIFQFSNYKKSDISELPLKTKDGQLMIDTDKLISENKSGISKAIKIVKFDFDNEMNYVKVETNNDEKFIIDIAIQVSNLLKI